MSEYFYDVAIAEDVRNYIDAHFTRAELREKMEDRWHFAEKLNDELWTADSVTGNGSGSYTFSAWQAEEYICHNLDLLADALEEFGGDMNPLRDGAEACDVTIRCYLLPSAISDVLDEIEKELENEDPVDVYNNARGETLCECGALLERDDRGDMPDFCPDCGKKLNYEHIINEEE